MVTAFEKAHCYVSGMMANHRPLCGHPKCNEQVFQAAIVQHESDEHVMFVCRDMGHWTGNETEVRWVRK